MVRLLLAALLLVIGLPATSCATERPTRVVLYTVTDPITGKLRVGYTVAEKVSGSCWIGSLSAARPDAWRCMAGNEIHDPCFVPDMNVRVVYCPDYRDRKRLVAIALTKPLPFEHANHGSSNASSMPTQLVLAGGVTCGYATGATGVVGGMRINYGCSDGRMLLGGVDRSLPRWRIYAMPRSGSSDITLVDVDSAIF